MKNLLLFLITGLLCLSTISALEISAEYDTNIIVQDIENQIQLTIEVINATPGIYNLYTLADISIKPSETFTINEDPFTKTFTLKPTKNLNVEGYYSFTYILNHRGVNKTEKTALIKLVDLKNTIEIDSNSISIDSDQITFHVQNKEPVELKNLSAKFSSILFETEKTFDLKPNEKFEISVAVDKDRLRKTKAGTYIIEAIFKTKKGEVKTYGNLYLGEKKGITSTEDTSGFLIRNEIITKINSGNVDGSVQVKIKRNIFSRLFTNFNTEPTFVDRNGLFIEYTWIKERLKPTETYIIKAKTNYVFPFLIILVAIVILLGLKRLLQTKIEIRKSVSHVKTKSGEFALKINLSLKAKKNIENLTLIDKVPAIVKIYKKFGMVKPDKIDAESRRIHWNIGDLNQGEVRVFNYIVYSKVGIVGKFSLPEALAVFEKDGKLHEVASNKVFFMSDQIKKD